MKRQIENRLEALEKRTSKTKVVPFSRFYTDPDASSDAFLSLYHPAFRKGPQELADALERIGIEPPPVLEGLTLRDYLKAVPGEAIRALMEADDDTTD